MLKEVVSILVMIILIFKSVNIYFSFEIDISRDMHTFLDLVIIYLLKDTKLNAHSLEKSLLNILFF